MRDFTLIPRTTWLKLMLATVIERVNEKVRVTQASNRPCKVILSPHQKFTIYNSREAEQWHQALRQTVVANSLESELEQVLSAWSMAWDEFYTIVSAELGPQSSYATPDIIEAMRKHYKFPALFTNED